MDIDVIEVNTAVFNRYPEVLDLLRRSFAYMDSRIDPPSSLHRIDVPALVSKSQLESLFVATADDKMVACVFASVEHNHVYLGKLAVDAAYRNSGIAGMLIEKVETLALERGVDRVELETRVELVENQRFFEKLGFKKIAENAHAGYSRVTSYRYRKLLNG